MEEKNNGFEINLRDFWKILLRCWWIMLAAAVVMASGTYLFLRATHTDMYTAKASIWVMREKSSPTGQTATADVSIANNIINDVILIAETNLVLDAVREETGTALSNSSLKGMLKATKANNADAAHIVTLSVTAKTPDEAKILTNSLAHNICDTMNNYLFDSENYTKIIDEATLPTSPSNPVSKLRVLIAAMVGAVLVYVVFFVLFLLDDKINSADDVRKYLEISVLGEIPNRRDVSRRKKKYGTYYQSYDDLKESGGTAQ